MTTSVPRPTFSNAGFVIPATADVLAGVLADINNAFGGGLDTDLRTPQGQLATSETSVIDNTNMDFLTLTQMFDPAYSRGRYQDALARIYFIERNPSQSTVVEALCSGLQGVVIPQGALAIADDGSQYVCIEAGVIPVEGSITLSFAALIPGPIACPAGALNQIYRAIPGWDSIDNVNAGVIGKNTETRAEFERRRSLSVALNSIGSLPSVLGSVLNVSGVLDAYVTENVNNTPTSIGGVMLLPNSLFVAAVGGTSQDVAEAIWRKKAPGCAYNGNTTVTVYDTSVGYVPPYPTYSVTYQIPNPLEILFEVNINNTLLVPADAAVQIRNAIIAAAAGEDGGGRAKIGTTLYASRFYTPVALLGLWAQIVSIKIGSNNNTSATFTASIAALTMTVTAVASGVLAVGQTISDVSGNLIVGTKIVNQLTGSAGGTGTYTISNTQTVGSEPMKSAVPNLFEIDVHIDQVPVISAANITVILT